MQIKFRFMSPRGNNKRLPTFRMVWLLSNYWYDLLLLVLPQPVSSPARERKNPVSVNNSVVRVCMSFNEEWQECVAITALGATTIGILFLYFKYHFSVDKYMPFVFWSTWFINGKSSNSTFMMRLWIEQTFERREDPYCNCPECRTRNYYSLHHWVNTKEATRCRFSVKHF